MYYVKSRLNKGFADENFLLCQFMTAVKKVNFLGCAKSFLTCSYYLLKGFKKIKRWIFCKRIRRQRKRRKTNPVFPLIDTKGYNNGRGKIRSLALDTEYAGFFSCQQLRVKTNLSIYCATKIRKSIRLVSHLIPQQVVVLNKNFGGVLHASQLNGSTTHYPLLSNLTRVVVVRSW